MSENIRSLQISGYGSCTGGTFDKVSIEGKGTVHGDIGCNSFDTSGVGKINGNVKAEKFSVSGVLNITGNVKATKVDISGVNKTIGDFSGNELKCDGIIKIENDMEFENINISGSINTKGFINCENLSIFLHGTSTCNEIGASKIVILPNEKNKSIFNFFIPKKFKENKLVATSIEGDDIRLENCEVKTVKGKKIVIGPNCKIGEIEYSESIEIDKSSKVEKNNKIG